MIHTDADSCVNALSTIKKEKKKKQTIHLLLFIKLRRFRLWFVIVPFLGKKKKRIMLPKVLLIIFNRTKSLHRGLLQCKISGYLYHSNCCFRSKKFFFHHSHGMINFKRLLSVNSRYSAVETTKLLHQN